MSTRFFTLIICSFFLFACTKQVQTDLLIEEINSKSVNTISNAKAPAAPPTVFTYLTSGGTSFYYYVDNGLLF